MQFGALCRQYTIFDQIYVRNWESFVKITVLIAFNIKPACDSAVTKSCKSKTVSAYDFANNKMSSAKRKSSNAGTVASFAAGHRALYRNDLLNMDVSYRKLCRQIVGPPPGTNWNLNWHDFFFRLFDRRMFRSKDCFTGRFPGIEHDASHLYTGGSRMCRGEGQVQAGPKEGAESLV